MGDAPCLHRLEGMGLASSSGDDQRYTITTQGHARHRTEILKQPT
ncbi:hypothetical protein SXCC_02891 [Gluconacetobacter sp. SXCC-1]|nr:hypothetical protein SXCC_02891 [Gluconacetobacter sp. SXCC-1]